MYTSEAGMTAATSPPVSARATTSTVSDRASAESRPGTSTPTIVKRIVRTRPSRSDNIPQTGRIKP